MHKIATEINCKILFVYQHVHNIHKYAKLKVFIQVMSYIRLIYKIQQTLHKYYYKEEVYKSSNIDTGNIMRKILIMDLFYRQILNLTLNLKCIINKR